MGFDFFIKMLTTWFQFTKYFMMSFFTCTIAFNIVGISYLCIRSICDNTMTKELKIFLQVMLEIGTNLAKMTKDLSNRIITFLFISDSAFMNNMELLAYEDRYTERFSRYMDIMTNQKQIDSMGLITDKTMLLEYTPVGNVLMKYDTNNHCFVYYSNRSLTTLQLQSIGRKFIIDFYCPGVVQDMKKSNDSEDKTNKTGEEKEAIDDTTPKKNTGGIASRTGVMAKLKSSQSQPKKSVSNTEKETLDETTENIIEKDPYLEIVNDFKFVKKGQLADISFTQSIKHPRILPNYTNTTSLDIQIGEIHDTTKQINIHEKHAEIADVDKSKLSFAEYKKLMSK